MTTAETIRQQGRRAGRSEGVEWLGRTGLVAQGTIYGLVALLAIQVALGGRDASHEPDKRGALKLVADQPAGGWLLGALALGFAAYALWRFAQAFVDRSGKGNDAKALAKRFGYFCIGAWYGVLAFLAVEVLLGSGGSGGNEQKTTAGVLGWPLGREVVFAVAAGFVAAAGWNVYRALSGKLEKHLRTHDMSDGERTTVLAIGGVGHLARGAIFALIGAFLARAAIEFDPKEARGLDGALLSLTQQPYGRLILGGIAVGLAAFGLWCFAQARYRRV
jgi:uncharacterized protein DUF1206